MHKKNCPYTGPPKLLDNDGQKLLAKNCPHLMIDSGNGINTCCDTNQLRTMDTNIKLASNFLSRCPSCLDNLVKHFCEFTCSTQQSKFINVTEIQKENGNNLNYFFSNFLIFHFHFIFQIFYIQVLAICIK